jgi:cytochrome c oxidase cbb3-type subunit 3
VKEPTFDTPTPSTPAPAPTPADARLTDHTYDGIQEYDNPLPGWWVAIFWAAIVFAPFYAVYYHGGPDRLIADDYARDLAAHAEAEAKAALESGTVDEESLAALGRDAHTMDEGAALFQQNCTVCHNDRGQGKIGPNLTDDAWIHGGSLVQIHHTIDQGVPDKGMLAWGKQLPPDVVKKLAAFVGTRLRGTHVAGLPPQGPRTEAPARTPERP